MVTTEANHVTPSPLRWLKAAAVLLAVPLLAGCIEQSRADLDAYVEEVLARSSTKIEPLPPIRPYEIYTYRSGEENRKDPFVTFFAKEETDAPAPPPCTPGVDPDCVAPDPDRNKEELEFFPLDSLRMVGTLEQEEDIFGVILGRDGTIYRVTVDNYMGQNHGRIINIQEEGIDLLEIVPNGQGGWLERPTRVALAE